MKVLVLGGAGYLGSELCHKLLIKNHYVTIYDNNTYDSWAYPSNLFYNFYQSSGVKADILDGKQLSYFIQQNDVVVHLAGIVGDKACDLDKKRTIEVNQIATQTIAELCHLYEKKMIFASSCSVYGQSGDRTFTEPDIWQHHPVWDVPLSTLSLYALTKADSERGIWYHILDDARYCILRMGTLFGLSHRMRFDLAINRFVAQACTGEPITIYGGDQWRPWLFIGDAVDAYVQAIENDWQGLYNLASFNMQLGEVGKEIMHIAGGVVDTYHEQTDRRSYKADYTKALKAGFVPTRSLETGIAPIIDAFKDGQFKNWKAPKYDNFLSLSLGV